MTRTYFERRAALESGQTAADMKAILANPAGSAKRGRGFPKMLDSIR